MVSAGENIVITSPADEVELKASVVPAPPAGESLTFLWDQWVSLVAQMVKSPPAMQETRVQTLDLEDPLEKGNATYSSILAWRIPWTEEPGGLQSMGSQRDEHN